MFRVGTLADQGWPVLKFSCRHCYGWATAVVTVCSLVVVAVGPSRSKALEVVEVLLLVMVLLLSFSCELLLVVLLLP